MDESVPAGRLGNPLLAVFAILCLIGAATLGLIAVNGDDFTEARIPARPKLPFLPAAPGAREVAVTGTLGPPVSTAVAHELRPADRERVQALADTLGFRGELLIEDGRYVIADGDRTLRVNRAAGSSYLIDELSECDRSGSAGDCRIDTASSRSGRLGPDDGAAATTTTTRRPRPVPGDALLPQQRAGVLASRLASLHRGATAQVEPGEEPLSLRVTVTHRVAGETVPGLRDVVVVGPGAAGGASRIVSAVGWLGTPVAVGTYPLVGTDPALVRLRAGLTVGDEDPTDPTRQLEIGDPRQDGRCTSFPDGTAVCPSDGPGAPDDDAPAPGGRTSATAGPLTVTAFRSGSRIQIDFTGTAYVVPVHVFATIEEGDLAVAAAQDTDLLDLSVGFGFDRGGTVDGGRDFAP